MAKKVDGMVESTDAQASVPGSAAEALKKHEAAKMSRRAVLSKVGLNFGAAALLALSVDDLARKVTATIAANNRDNEVAQAVAQEFKNAGIAFADDADSSNLPCTPCSLSCVPPDDDYECVACGDNCAGEELKKKCADSACVKPSACASATQGSVTKKCANCESPGCIGKQKVVNKLCKENATYMTCKSCCAERYGNGTPDYWNCTPDCFGLPSG